jgi:glycerol-3-phosphate O-acyltransferase
MSEMKQVNPVQERRRYSYYAWLKWILKKWISLKVVPQGSVIDQLGLDLSRPVCYLTRSNSILDVLTADIYLEQMGLPRPIGYIEDLGKLKTGAHVYLSKVGSLRTYGPYRNQPPSPFYALLKRAETDPKFDVQVVPLSIFWGRDPGSSEKSLFKLFFPDDERAGFFQKSLIILANGRDGLMSIGKPIWLREQMTTDSSLDQIAKKLNRVVRVHFQSKRNASLGPGLLSRGRVVEQLLRTKALKETILDESKKKNVDVSKVQQLASQYIAEISAEVNPQVIRGTSILLKRLWKRLFGVVHIFRIQQIQAIPQSAEIVYLPCHRSHIDYLLLNYALYENGIVTPHVAAGANLNFWPAGSYLRRLGAFYIRRSFNNNKLYTVVFSEYVSFLLQRGSPLQFFIEGGRSRTGKLLHPKTGMLAMVVQTYLKFTDKPIWIVPVYIGYDNVLEIRTYKKELSGSKKQSESIGQLVKSGKALKRSYGDAFINFGRPFELSEFLKEAGVDLNQPQPIDTKPTWLVPVVNKLADKTITEINNSAVVGPIALVSLVLNATKNKAMPQEDLLSHLKICLDFVRDVGYSSELQVIDGDALSYLEHAEKFGGLQRFRHSSGDVLHFPEPQASYSVYSRNNILHVFSFASLIANYFQHNDQVEVAELESGIAVMFPILKHELHIGWKSEELNKVINQHLQTLIRLGLLVEGRGGSLVRPDVLSVEFTILKTLGKILSTSIERLSIAILVLGHYRDKSFSKLDFEARCQQMAQRLSLLGGMSEIDPISSSTYSVLIENLMVSGALVSENQQIRVSHGYSRLQTVVAKLISQDVRASVSRSVI